MNSASSIDGTASSGTATFTRRGLASLLAAAVLGFVLYRPDTAAPFEVIDFSETLPIMTRANGFVERMGALLHYYVGHGRFTIIQSGTLAARWQLFGWWTPGWQWSRYVVMLAVIVLSWRLIRVLGATRLGASAGVSLFIVAEAAAPGWLRPTVNEPFGTVLLACAALLACRYPSTTHMVRDAIVLAVLLACTVLTKETLVAAVPFPVALALCRRAEGSWGRPERSSRNLVLVAAAAVAVALVAIPTLWAMTQTAPEGYARQYGASGISLSNALFALLPSLVPFTPVTPPPALAVLLADLAYLMLLLVGWRLGPTDSAERRTRRYLLMAGLALPAARVLVYLPWPLQYPYYSIPYLLGPAILVAVAMSGFDRAGRTPRFLGVAAMGLVVAYAAATVEGQASRQFALRRLTNGLVGELYRVARGEAPDSIVVAVPREKDQMWSSLGPTLARYASATSRPLPPVTDRSCEEARAEIAHAPPRRMLAALRWQCDLGAGNRLSVREVAHRFDLNRLRLVRDTLYADIVSAGAMAGNAVAHRAPLPAEAR